MQDSIASAPPSPGPIERPAPVHVIGGDLSEDERPLEATELCALPSPQDQQPEESGRHSSTSQFSTELGAGSSSGQACRSRKQRSCWRDPVRKFWKQHVAVIVPAEKQRDHLALERTFLGYIRTALALSMTGVIIAQLFRLQHTINPDMEFGFYVVGKPLAAVFIGSSMVITLLGAYRFWRQQYAMVRGKIHAGGWEIYTIMVVSILLSLTLFAIAVGVDVRKELYQ